jgi:hypothetical protein
VEREERVSEFCWWRPVRNSGGLPIVGFEQSSQSLVTLHSCWIPTGSLSRRRKRPLVDFALVIAFLLVMDPVLSKGSVQGRLTKQNELGEAVLFD